MSKEDDLKEIRKKLRRRFDVVQSGFSYESVFGSRYASNILVRVELRAVDAQNYKFYVFLDYRLPVTSDVEFAGNFLKEFKSAIRKATWAEKVTEGRQWSIDELDVMHSVSKKEDAK